MLSIKGIRCDLAESAQVALDWIAEKRYYDVMIIDYHMPQTDGLSLIRSIRSMPDLEKQPVIFLHSSSDDGSILEECEKLGVHFTMVKPVKMRELFRNLSRIHFVSQNPPPEKEKQEKELSHLPYKVLLVEDNSINMTLTSLLVRRLLPGAQIIEAYNGEEGIHKFRENNPDIVFMDIHMPILDGYMATREIRKLENFSTPRTPVVALTAATVKGEIERCHDAGMDDYLSKPVGMKQMKEALLRNLF